MPGELLGDLERVALIESDRPIVIGAKVFDVLEREARRSKMLLARHAKQSLAYLEDLTIRQLHELMEDLQEVVDKERGDPTADA